MHYAISLKYRTRAERIAGELGKMSVAPVISYVHEGAYDPPHHRLIADHGGSQAPQAETIARLNAEWAAKGVRVIHGDTYYFIQTRRRSRCCCGRAKPAPRSASTPV